VRQPAVEQDTQRFNVAATSIAISPSAEQANRLSLSAESTRRNRAQAPSGFTASNTSHNLSWVLSTSTRAPQSSSAGAAAHALA
jgi:hypothetical protein